ncbi:hypothetical protein F4779DRAFT_618702 [Xylariaceae sp. FL0662B]|nr:hypothetical protein F4779DRAFT_618702 [Xylariaceae sp. FL0662B]
MNTDIWAYDHNMDGPSYQQTVTDAATLIICAGFDDMDTEDLDRALGQRPRTAQSGPMFRVAIPVIAVSSSWTKMPAFRYEFAIIDYYMLIQLSKFIHKGATILNGNGSNSFDGYQGV